MDTLESMVCLINGNAGSMVCLINGTRWRYSLFN